MRTTILIGWLALGLLSGCTTPEKVDNGRSEAAVAGSPSKQLAVIPISGPDAVAYAEIGGVT